MNWLWVAGKAVPWKTLLVNAPRIADATRRFYRAAEDRSVTQTSLQQQALTVESLQAEVERLQEIQAEQAELVYELAQQLEGAANSIATLRMRQWVAVGLAVAAALAAVLGFISR